MNLVIQPFVFTNGDKFKPDINSNIPQYLNLLDCTNTYLHPFINNTYRYLFFVEKT